MTDEERKLRAGEARVDVLTVLQREHQNRGPGFTHHEQDACMTTTPTKNSSLWATPENEIVGWVVEGAWQGAIGDRPRVTALVVVDPDSGARRLIYFCPLARKLKSIEHP